MCPQARHVSSCTIHWIWLVQKYLSAPFVHSHKQNEEIYAVLSGRGTMVVDGETVELQAGDWLRVAPAGERQLSAAADSAISVICIQVKAGSLEGFTMTDGVVK